MMHTLLRMYLCMSYHPRTQGDDSLGAVLRAAAVAANPTLFQLSRLVPGSLNPALRALARALNHPSNTSCEVCASTTAYDLSLVEKINAYYLLLKYCTPTTNPLLPCRRPCGSCI